MSITWMCVINWSGPFRQGCRHYGPVWSWKIQLIECPSRQIWYVSMEIMQVFIRIASKYQNITQSLWCEIVICQTASNRNVTVTGNVFVGGRKINPVKFRDNIAYVMQDDALLATATPREALEFSANLRSVCNMFGQVDIAARYLDLVVWFLRPK